MKEFGSDFHLMSIEKLEPKIKLPSNSLFLGCGRDALKHLILENINVWEKLYIPEYFCYEVINSIRETGINVAFYPDYPLGDDIEIISNMKFQEGDVLLRMNYFGLRGGRDNINIPVPVIEDHSHDLFSTWALNSNADWCVASLRKNLPIPDGGVLWSPKGLLLDSIPCLQKSHLDNVKKRLLAMTLKKRYLNGDETVSKEFFLNLYRETETAFSDNEVSLISKFSENFINNIPINIRKRKLENYNRIITLLNKSEKYDIYPCNSGAVPFALILIFKDIIIRDKLRKELISSDLYPVVLWNIDNPRASAKVIDFSERMLMIHIDYRYSLDDISLIASKINKAISKYKN